MFGMLTQLEIIQLFSRVIINDHIGHFCEIVVMYHCYWVSDHIFLETVVYQLRCGLHLVMHIHYPLLVYG